ncbi:MAG: BrnA antitoxin family protein [Chloroflexota bacterium]
MNGKNTTRASNTDWERIDALADEDINTADIPPLDDDFFAKAELRMPKKKMPVTIRLDPDILTWFRSTGKGYQTRINAVLRMYVDAKTN